VLYIYMESFQKRLATGRQRVRDLFRPRQPSDDHVPVLELSMNGQELDTRRPVPEHTPLEPRDPTRARF
jgi:hypothetical protein